jgi:hypothetical protein
LNQQKSAAKHGATISPGKKADIKKALRDLEAEETGVQPRWKPTGKQVATVAVGAAVAGALIYGGYKLHQKGGAEGLIEDLKAKSLALDPDLSDTTKKKNSSLFPWVDGGSPISSDRFNDSVRMSQKASWSGGKGYIQDSSFDQKEFELPAGHLFRRLSTKEEVGFWGPTYTTGNTEDWKRYVTNFRHEKWTDDLKMITFTANKPVRVPDLTTRLNALKTVMGSKSTDTEVLNLYKSMSGGSWKGSTADKFFAELKRLGYGAIIDDMDAGVIGESPLVLFDTDLVGPKTSTKLTNEAIKAAESTLTEIRNRKK